MPGTATVVSERTPCNLVMKGAIVSGVVYPSAINKLKDHHDFRNIGGTSAGAIAAAAAAAAEYCRQAAIHDGNDAHVNDGFDRLEQLTQKFTNQGPGGPSSQPNLLSTLFQPAQTTKPLLDVLSPLLVLLKQKKEADNPPPLINVLGWMQKIWPQIPGQMLRFVNDVLIQWEDDYAALRDGKTQGSEWGGFIGAVVGILLAFAITGIVSLFVPVRMVLIIVLLPCLLLLGGGVAWGGSQLGMWLVGTLKALLGLNDLLNTQVYDNKFGICIGHTPEEQQDPARPSNLTDWLYEIYNQMADLPLNQPLTFGHLQDRGIELRMVTSNISHGRPYIMPNELTNFIWREEDLSLFFPKVVIEYMKANEDTSLHVTLPSDQENHFHFFPSVKNLPVVLAVRLSISFPLLLSAVPLYTIDREGMTADADLSEPIAANRMQQNWFSDGGICSNLPIQFFDEWLPTYPTFGINLTSLRPVKVTPAQLSILPRNPLQVATQSPLQTLRQLQLDGQPQQSTQTTPATQPAAQSSAFIDDNPQVYLPRASEPYIPEWVEQKGLFAFFNAILGTGLYHRELSQVGLPSYRERVVQIRLAPDEEGLNLDMDANTVNALVQKGDAAGTLLTDTTLGFNIEQYKWVRLLVFMKQFEDNLNKMKDPNTKDVQSYQDILAMVQANPQAFPFPQNEQWHKGTESNLEKLLQLSCNDWCYVGESLTAFTEDGIAIQDGIVLQVVPSC